MVFRTFIREGPGLRSTRPGSIKTVSQEKKRDAFVENTRAVGFSSPSRSIYLDLKAKKP